MQWRRTRVWRWVFCAGRPHETNTCLISSARYPGPTPHPRDNRYKATPTGKQGSLYPSLMALLPGQEEANMIGQETIIRSACYALPHDPSARHTGSRCPAIVEVYKLRNDRIGILVKDELTQNGSHRYRPQNKSTLSLAHFGSPIRVCWNIGVMARQEHDWSICHSNTTQWHNLASSCCSER